MTGVWPTECLNDVIVVRHICGIQIGILGFEAMSMFSQIRQLNESTAVWLTKAFGTMTVCYMFMIYGLLPVFAAFQPYQEWFLYWSNWIQLWSLPLLLVGTNILGRDAETRARIDHKRLSQSYDEQKKIYHELLAMLKRQEEIMQGLLKQDQVLNQQNIVLAEQTQLLKTELELLKKPE